jgi:hypothetical protein
MFDRYMIVGEEFKNVKDGGKVTGFQVGIRLPYYRGVVLSLIGDMVISVDGEKIPTDKMKVTIGGKTLPLSQLEHEPVAKWEFGNTGILTVDKPGGLKAGEHVVEYKQHMKISYVPSGFWGQDKKTLQITD